MKKEDGNLFDVMLSELENTIGKKLQPLGEDSQMGKKPITVELSLRGVQLSLLPFLSMADALERDGETPERVVLQRGSAKLTQDDIQSLRSVFHSLDALCKRVGEMERKQRDTTDPRFPRS